MIDNDYYHEKAHILKSYIKNEKKLINNIVLVEVLNSLKKHNHKLTLDEIKNVLLSYDNIDFLTSEKYNDSFELFKHYNQSINYSDCTIVKTMMDYNTNIIASFDSDFDKINGIKRIFL